MKKVLIYATFLAACGFMPAMASNEKSPFAADAELHPVLLKGDEAPSPGPRKAAVDPPSDNPYESRTSSYNALRSPDGRVLYYTARYDTQRIVFNEYYTETIKTGFTFTFYDENNRRVGEIRDVLRFAENERWDGNGTWFGRDVECVLAPTLSFHFFNDDDLPEVMVYHAMNTVNYINHYYYSVYSIGGKKDKNGYDIPICQIEGRLVESINYPLPDDPENMYYTFVLDPVVDWPLNDPDALTKLHASKFVVTTYQKAVDETGPRILITKDIGNTHIPGDTTEGIYYMHKKADGRLYFIYSQYEKPCFVDPRGGAIDESQTPDNSLMIEVYATQNGETPQEVSTTKVPLVPVESTDQLIYTFLSIGSVAWRDDVDMIVNGTPQAPAFVVKRDVAAAATIDDMSSSLHIYDNEGRHVRTIVENCQEMKLFQDAGKEPLLMFLVVDDEYNYQFDFITLYHGEKLASIRQANDGDPLYSSCAPIRHDDDTFSFVFEMVYFETDDDGNLFARVAWFDNAGNLDHIDKINMGTDVQASMVYMDRAVLRPDLYDDDEGMEYAVLVKRLNGPTTRNEYLVVDDNGYRYATFSADDGKGDPYLFTVMPGNPDRLVVSYTRGTDVYDLPFKNPSIAPTGVNSVMEDVECGGSKAEFYDLQGRKVTNPEKGVYIRKTGAKVEKVLVE